jgi:hypothetical protein
MGMGEERLISGTTIGSATSTGSATNPDGKIGIVCPAAVKKAGATITDCPETGWGPSLDPNLNKHKNIETHNDAQVDKDLAFLTGLPDPVPDFRLATLVKGLKRLGNHEALVGVKCNIDRHNQSPKPFIWTARAADILEKVKRARRSLNKRQSA